MPGSEVRRAPLNGAPDQARLPDDAGHPLLHEAVAQGDEGVHQPQVEQRPESALQVRRLERDEGEVEGTFEPRRIRVGLETHPTLLAEVVYEQAFPAHSLDVFFVRVEDGDAVHLPRHLSRRDAADGASADDEHVRLDHNSLLFRPASTGGSPSSSSFSAE